MDQIYIINMIRQLDKRLERIEKLLEENKKSAAKMDNHIDFIDSVYDTVRLPISRVLSVCGGKKVEIQEKANMIEDIV